MKKVLTKVSVLILNIIYFIFKPIKIQNKVTLISRQADTASIDFKLLEKELNKRNIKNTILCKTLNSTLFSVISYSFHMLVQMYYLATSKVVVLDGYCILASILKKKKDQKIFQIWHSLAAIKKFGWQSMDKIDGHNIDTAKIMKMHNNYDYVAVSSMESAKHFSEAFNTPIDRFVLLGLPRIEYLVDIKNNVNEDIYEEYPIMLQKENVMYAPTFRKGRGIDMEEMVKYFPFEKYNLIIKKHPLDDTDYSIYKEKGVIFDEKFPSLEWFGVCSKVISDYSGITFESMVAGCELYFYLPDIDEYDYTLGLNMDFEKEAISKYVFKKGKDLCKSLSEEYDYKLLEEFKKKYIVIDESNVTKDMADFIEKLVN